MTVQQVFPRIPGQIAPGIAAPATQAQADSTSRLLFVDNVRLTLTILVVVFHLAVTYGAEGSWFYRERPVDLVSAVLLSAFVALNQAYFMGLFFFIAGYFVPGALDRKGTWVFLRDRLIRLGIPLVLFCLLISPAIEGVMGMTEGWPGATESGHPFALPRPRVHARPAVVFGGPAGVLRRLRVRPRRRDAGLAGPA